MAIAGINLDEPIGKWVGRRNAGTTGLDAGLKLQSMGSRLRTGLRARRAPRGVFRFHSHEEANEWWMQVWTGTLKK